jgi:hypothetical protein
VYVVGQEPATTSSPNRTGVIVPPQLSVAVGVPNVGLAVPQATVALEGQTVNTGAVLSGATVNVALHVLGASQLLVTVNVTVLEPPHLFGAAPSVLVTDPRPHPPVAVAVVNQFANAASTWP